MTELPERLFQPIRPNPFIVGNPVRGRAMFFGRESEFELVRRRLTGGEQGGLLIFCGERRSGKTSILFQIMDGRLGPDFVPVLIDMQSMAIPNESDFLTKVGNDILAACGLPAPAGAPPGTESQHPADAFQALVARALAALTGRTLVIMFDEYELFENKIESGVLSADVLHVLSGLMEHRSVFVVFTGSQNLEERRRDYWKILGKSIYRTISYLERSDALNLIQRPVSGLVDYSGDTVERIYRLTAGQPFYTQAVCQNLVDRLNDAGTRVADDVRLGEVLDDLIQNALPQMIFLWEGLEQDDRLTMALLGECLAEPDAWATAEALIKRIRKKGYPVELTVARLATVLEKLFRQEMLLKDDHVDSPGYAFRMDLWRLWMRRMHSVWQVAREVGLAVPNPGSKRARAVLLTVLGLVVVAIAARAVWPPARPAPVDLPHEILAGPVGWLSLEVTPAEAGISLGGRRIALGSYNDSIPADRELRYAASAPGYADSVFPVRAVPHAPVAVRVALRPLLGDLRIDTNPSQASIRVDGHERGAAPLVIRSLPVPAAYRVEARAPGRSTTFKVVRVEPGIVTGVRLDLPPATAQLAVSSEPAGARVSVQGVAHGQTPVSVGELGTGDLPVTVQLAGYQRLDTMLVIRAGANALHAKLLLEPPGALIVQGDRPAQIFVDGDLVVENTQNSGTVKVQAGSHEVRVVLTSGETVDSSFVIASRERVVFDYSKRTLRRARP